MLLLIWMLIPIILPCLPYIFHYHSSLRLFLVFVVPFSILSVIGLMRLAKILAKYLKLSEVILMTILGVMMIGSNPHFNLMRYCISRKDIRIIRVPTIPTLHGRLFTPSNTYIVLVPFNYLRFSRPYLDSDKSCQIVYRIERQGGKICTIYYKP